MSTALKELEHFAIKAKRKKHPDLPEFAMVKPKYSDRTANGLTKCIIDYLRLIGCQAERVSNTGRVIDKRTSFKDAIGRTRTIGKVEYVYGTGTNGTSDIHSVIAGRSVKIEVKIGRDKQSDAQIAYQRSIEEAGGIYIIATSFEQFKNELSELKLIS